MDKDKERALLAAIKEASDALEENEIPSHVTAHLTEAQISYILGCEQSKSSMKNLIAKSTDRVMTDIVKRYKGNR